MYLRHLTIRNCKLIRELRMEFEVGGAPRMWTMFVAENGLCKTSLLRCIAAAAMGPEIASQLADVGALPDKRRPNEQMEVLAQFGFSRERHASREYPPGLRMPDPPDLQSELYAQGGHSLFRGASGYMQGRSGMRGMPPGPKIGVSTDPRVLSPLSEARSKGISDWFVAAYGVGRILQGGASPVNTPDRSSDRVASLFRHDQLILGTRFADLFEPSRSRQFAEVLRDAFVDTGILPGVINVELRGKGGVRTASDLVESHRFELTVGASSLKIPATWLSQGYQAIISLVADIIGQVWMEADDEVPLAEMEGLVLIDEIDLHLHPKWQTQLVTCLRRAFPRLQFIATTHSPMMLAGLEQHEVYILRQEEVSGDVVVAPAPHSPALLTGSELLDSFFEIHRLYPSALGEKASEYGRLATDETRSAGDDQRMLALRRELAAAGIEFDWEPVPRVAGG